MIYLTDCNIIKWKNIVTGCEYGSLGMWEVNKKYLLSI
jgi:hypothetical protein